MIINGIIVCHVVELNIIFVKNVLFFHSGYFASTCIDLTLFTSYHRTQIIDFAFGEEKKWIRKKPASGILDVVGGQEENSRGLLTTLSIVKFKTKREKVAENVKYPKRRMGHLKAN